MDAGRNFNVKEFVLGVGITTGFFLLVVLNPIVGFVFSLIAPLPIAYFYWKMGRIAGIALFALSFGLLVAVFQIGGFVESLPFFLVLGSAGIIIPEVLKRRYGIEKTVGLSAAGLAALIFAMLALLQQQTPTGAARPARPTKAIPDRRQRTNTRRRRSCFS